MLKSEENKQIILKEICTDGYYKQIIIENAEEIHE
jgi:hypothetical protein